MESKELPTEIDYIYHARNRDEIKDVPSPGKVAEWMHEYAVLFAKWHVKEALKSASEHFDAPCNKHVIENAYPLGNIK